MILSASSCFLEDAACVIISAGAWRRHPFTSGEKLTTTGDKNSWMDQLLFFLGRALVFTRNTLYVLVCSGLPGNNASQTSAAWGQYSEEGCAQSHYDAADFVSCGAEAWRFCVWLSTKLEHLIRQLEVTASPIILPWETSEPVTSGATNGTTVDCRHWVHRARAAVIRHYLLTLPETRWWLADDEALFECAVPLLFDPYSAFTCHDICELWPRHCHLSFQNAAGPAFQLDRVVAVSKEASDSSTKQVPPASNKEGHHGSEASVLPEKRASFKYTVVAGTFDRLHGGHKLLLAAAALATSEAVGLAVSAGPLVNKKTDCRQCVAAADIEPFPYRLQAAVAFLQLVAASRCRNLFVSGFSDAVQKELSLPSEWQHPSVRNKGLQEASSNMKTFLLDPVSAMTHQCSGASLQLQVFRLTDAIGPADRLAFDCLVVSEETIPGANAVNTVRVQLGHEPVSLLIVELVPKDAQGISKVVAALESALPFSLEEMDKTSEPSSDTLEHGDVPVTPAKHGESSTVANVDVRSTADEDAQTSPPAPNEAFRNKVSSTALRQQQWRRLRCGLLSWLCTRFNAAWLWLVESRSELKVMARQSATIFWRFLCAEHASPWRRLHTFERVARSLKRLDEEQLCARAEPVVLCIFLGSLLACPCRCITLTTGACVAPDCSFQSGTAVSWTPEAEREVWQRTAKRVLAELQSSFSEALSDQQAVGSTKIQEATEELAQATASQLEDSFVHKDRYSLLMDLLCEQRVASLASLATPPQPDSRVHGILPTHACGRTETTTRETAELVRMVRRLEQLEYTDGFETLTMRMRRLRDEYFFIEDPYFNLCRRMQLTDFLEQADCLDSLQQQERLRATSSVKRELEIVEQATVYM